MSNELIISVSGLRGIVGDTLTAAVAHRYAAAFAATLPAGPVVVTRDGRANGPPLVEPTVAGLSQGGGRKVLDGGIAATPTTGVLVRQHHCAGGIQISASHNPAQYNGMKLFSAEGRVVPASAGEAVLRRYHEIESNDFSARDEERGSHGETLVDTTSEHLALIERIVDVDRIRGQRFRVLLDANHGSGSVLGRRLLERLNCEVVVLGGEPNGLFAHEPEPTPQNLASVLQEVTKVVAQIGFCQDPDADRLAIIDERGRYIGEEYTLALCVDHVLRSAPGPVVTNCSTSRMAEDLARKYGVPFFRSAVGEANVVDEMLKRGAILGGEGNGGVIDPRVVLVRDSFVGMALVLDAMAARKTSISALAAELPSYAIHKAKVSIPRDAIGSALNSLEQHFSDAKSDRLDGLRLDWGHGNGSGSWLLVRASNTEPIVRIIAEAPTESRAAALCDEAAKEMCTPR
ncbi:MAG TPA: phosphoglucosamine mutase [Lacipirellulaceae bacterium]|nr:phosphoglucosamine mutase [Lacipirellulaceae bacterium]